MSATPQEAKQISQQISQALPMIRSGLKALDVKGYQAPLKAEMQKQGKALLELENTLKQLKASPTAQARPEVVQRLVTVIQSGKYYMQALARLMDPEFEDRVSNALRRALEQDIPAVEEAMNTMGLAYGAKPRAARLAGVLLLISPEHSRTHTAVAKRIRKVSKRLAFLQYLVTTSHESLRDSGAGNGASPKFARRPTPQSSL
jgi:Zn-dependent M16 (insulinase) family peptidase